MSALHEAARRVVTAWVSTRPAWIEQCNEAVLALEAALKAQPEPAQEADPTDPGHDIDVLREHVRHLERRVRQLHAQQAEPVAWVGDPSTQDYASTQPES